MTDVQATAVLVALDSQRAALALMTERLRTVRNHLPPTQSTSWTGVANAFYEYRRTDLESAVRQAIAELDGARDETDRAIATLASRVG